MPYSKKKKRGCPTCDGVDSRSCCRCRGKKRMCDWVYTKMGWAHVTELTADQLKEIELEI